MGEPITAKNARSAIPVDWPNGLNCYSFAAKCQNPGGSGSVACVPGAAGGSPVLQGSIDMASLFKACVADGFEDVSGGVLGLQHKFENPPACDDDHYLVAVFYDIRHSFHFARHLADGTRKKRQWVHKPSAAQAAHNMQGGHYLGTDPSNVPWAPHFQFVAYLRAPNDGIAVARGNF